VGTYDRQRAPDLSNEQSPWTHVARRIPAGASVLDLGCWDGLLLAALRDRGATRVRGVERDPEARARAEARGLDVVSADLDDPAWPDALGSERFDAVILADVVEHVRDPLGTLRRIVERVLAPGGRVVLSVPNVAHASVRLSLLVGDFDRTDRGILDRTHLHFFTRRSLHALLAEAGLAVGEASDVVIDVPETVVASVLARAEIPAEPALVASLTGSADARAYQFVIAATPVPAGAAVPAPPPATAGDVPRVVDRLLRAQASKIRRLEERIRLLEGKGPLRFVRYAALRLRQRGERRREA
jgi:methionine biosynthesis protein MetW